MPVQCGEQCLSRWEGDVWKPCEVISVDKEGDQARFYIHWLELDRRLDHWVSVNDVKPFASDEEKKKYLSEAKLSSAPPAQSHRPLTRRDKRKFKDLGEHPMESDPTIAELEREHAERTKVRNLDSIVIGKYQVSTWYFSPYPEEVCTEKKLYICEFCLKYMRKYKTLEKHQSVCTLRHPPGNEIYRNGNLSVFEVDGMENKVYCQCLCLLSKLFLDHKTLYYDVDPFLFYILTECDAQGCHVVGYFSKEKTSIEGYNVACILTFPQYQRKGYGRFLIELSYELSKREGKVGSPEKPLSDLGKVSYRAYWTQTLLETLHRHSVNLSIRDLSHLTSIKLEDVIATLKHLDLVQYCRGEHIISVAPKLIETHLLSLHKKIKQQLRVDPTKLEWKPRPPKVSPTANVKDRKKP